MPASLPASPRTAAPSTTLRFFLRSCPYCLKQDARSFPPPPPAPASDFRVFARRTPGGSTTSFSSTPCALNKNWPAGKTGPRNWHAVNLRPSRRLAKIWRSIRIVGDVAIFVNYDSADVWMHRDLFRLNENLEPEVVSGVPPDFFSKTGQRWGNPLYRWDVMKSRGYEWWVRRLRWATRNCDYIRLDHFRGFDQFWEIPAADPSAT